ncbi:hypothetical protein GQ600_2830 [Phytophthora cactorum]|nr:hypothetical protein GQ600_2830 [Phytophthora cactorum]
MALTSETWPGTLAQARANYHKQKTFDGPFVVHLLMYAAKKGAEAIDSYLAERQDVRVGDIAHTHWAISHSPARRSGILYRRSVDPRLSNMEGVAEDVEGGIREEM